MSADSSSSTPSSRSLYREAIARRAHAIWVERGRPTGEDIAHWLAAEAELRAADQTNRRPARDVEDDTPITLGEPGSHAPADESPHGGQLPPPHRR